MPDTGAPWEIPFLDGTELVRGYPAFSEDLAEQVADGLSAAGAIAQYKQATDNTVRSISTSSFVDADLELVFTPTSADSLVVVEWSTNSRIRRTGTTSERLGEFRILSGTSPLAGAENATVGRELVSNSSSGALSGGAFRVRGFEIAGSTSPRTYKCQARGINSNIDLNRSADTTDICTGILSVMEIKAVVL